jgi:hypothetical protein
MEMQKKYGIMLMIQELDTTFSVRGATAPKECLFLSCVDNALTVFSDNVKQAIYYRLSKDHDLAKETIPLKVDIFENALIAIFGSGAKTILRLVVKNVYIEVGLKPPPRAYHISNLRKIRRRLNEMCKLKGTECSVANCIHFEGEEL